MNGSGNFPSEFDRRSATFSLTPIQRWFFQNNPANANHFNQSQLLNINASVTDRQLSAVFEALSQHHDMLRSRYVRIGQDIEATVLPDTQAVDFLSIQLIHLKGQPQRAALEKIGQTLGVALTCIGTIRKESGLVVYDQAGMAIPELPGGFDHFRP